METQKRSRKWCLALWGASLATAAVIAGIIVALATNGESEASTLTVQGFGLFATVLGVYGTINVAQKRVEKGKQNEQPTTGSN